MKSFQSYYTINEDVTKAAWNTSVWNMVYDSLRNLKMKSGDASVPLSNSLVKKLMPPSTVTVEATVFHKTDWEGLQALLKMQGSSKAISTSSKIFLLFTDSVTESTIPPSQFFTGIHRHGIVIKLTGSLLHYTTHDSMSAPDSNGRRWIDFFNFFSGYKNQIIIEDICEKINDEMNLILDDISEVLQQDGIISPYAKMLDVLSNDSRYICSEHELIEFKTRRLPKIKAHIISKYYDICHNAIQKFIGMDSTTNSWVDHIKKQYEKKAEKFVLSQSSYDEVIVNKIEIHSPIYYNSSIYGEVDMEELSKTHKFVGLDPRKGVGAIQSLSPKDQQEFKDFLHNYNWLKISAE